MKNLSPLLPFKILLIVIVAFSCEPTPTPDSPTISKVNTNNMDISGNWNMPYKATIDSIITQAVIDSIIPGAVVLISQYDQIIHNKAYGYAHLYDYGKVPLPTPESMTTSHVFDLASLTKVLATTMGIMKLVDQKKIGLDAPISKYLPQFADTEKAQITIRQLLSHTSGLAPWKPIYYHARNSKSVLNYIVHLPLAYPIGVERHYSDLGFMLLGYVIEYVSKMELDQYLNQTIYQPLGLTHTMFHPKDQEWPIAATSHGNPLEYKMVAVDDFGYKCDETVEDFHDWRKYTLIGEVNDGNAYYANEGIAGHAGLFSTAKDIQKILQLLINHGSFNKQQIISSPTIDEFIKIDQFGNGLGWAMSIKVLPVSKLPERAFGHTGFTGTYVLCLPDREISLILLTNRQNLDVKSNGSYQSVTQLRQDLSDYIISVTE